MRRMLTLVAGAMRRGSSCGAFVARVRAMSLSPAHAAHTWDTYR